MLTFAAKENHFVFNGVFYDQVNGVSMGSPLGPVLANIFMNNLERKAMDTFTGTKPKVYRRYVDDTFLIFSSRSDMLSFFEHMNSQHENITFTKEEENNDTLPFLDILITRQTDLSLVTSLYRKPTFSGLYLQWDSFVPKSFKRGLVNCLFGRAWCICSNYILFHKEAEFIKKTLLSNGYPSTFLDSCLQKFLTRKFMPPEKSATFGPEKKPVFISLPYCGESSVKLKRQLIRMFQSVAPWIMLRIVFKPVKKLASLCNLKDKVPTKDKSKVVYKIACNDCQEFYVGMTTRRLKQRMDEHATDENSALYKHSQSTGHNINYQEPNVLCTDNRKLPLLIKETLKIRELSASKSLNGNQGSFELKLW